MVLSQSINSTYPNCPSYNCSNILITYPFWRLDDESPSHFCGYEGFGINCSAIYDTELPNINLGGDPYHVQNIYYNTSIISLVEYDLSNIIHVPNDCPRVRHAIDLGTLPFNFSTSNVNISFHFNCTGYPSFANAIPCLYYNEYRASVNVVDSETESFDWSVYSCDEEVVTKVLREAIFVSETHQGIDYVRGLRRGFELNWWPVEDCRRCEESNGRCGRSNGTGELMCFCSDGTNQCYSYKGSGNKWIVKVVIGVGAPVLSIVLICTICYIMKFSLITYIPSFKHKCEDDRSVEAFIKQYGSLTTKRFCSDNHKRALIFEFMPNGSLEKFIHSQDPEKPSKRLEVMKLYEVALGIARGLDYLHRGCNPRILHLDIKPPNILLDQDFCPKIADFGLAKLYSRNESIVSMLEARGTIGYIAPEVFNRNIGGVSHKSDVYSYGMLILEMVGGNKNVDVGVGSKSTSDLYFPNWIYNRLENEEYVFDGISSAEENEYVRKMTIVGLWCIQTVPTQRPSIDEVIEMLEGSTGELEVPQKPSFPSIQAPVVTCSTSQSEQESNDLNTPYEL
ncbi:hypothetical protein L1987_72253 [Smallanthus sonchifolius]|uniref:Uncharacterized protein n=1 Tax=Smallanthus sonchifolius TaxID=185202 RepID=A0ACB9AVM0_9ASTR|nr:hypothetical protein L1987_72253 [Smallanthus sonchifolius]